MLGIGTVGIREIAKSKGDKTVLSRTFSGLIMLNAMTTAVCLITLIVATYAVPTLHEHEELMWIGALKLSTNFLLLDWFYRGLEDFKYITIRTLLVKVAYVVGVFLFVRERGDYPIYYLLSSLMIVVNALVNVAYARKFVRITLKNINVKQYVKPIAILGVYALLTSMYTSFNVAFLGFTAGEKEVGYYTTATKLYSVLLGLFSAFTGVMLPRMSSLISERRYDEFQRMLHRSFNLLITFAMPLVYFSIVMAPQIILVISGRGYEGAIMPMRIVMPLMLVIGYEQILVIQTLMPLREDKRILYNSICGAATGILLNVVLVPHLHSVGSAIVWGVSEMVVLCSAQYGVSKRIGTHFPFKVFVRNALYYIPMMLLLLPLGSCVSPALLSLAIGGVVMLAYCYILNVNIVKNEEVIHTIDIMKARITRIK